MSSPKITQRQPIISDEKPGTVYWCACGESKKQPYCDGSHQGSEFFPLRVEIESEKKVAWCACKQSGNKPFCDGSHKKLT